MSKRPECCDAAQHLWWSDRHAAWIWPTPSGICVPVTRCPYCGAALEHPTSANNGHPSHLDWTPAVDSGEPDWSRVHSGTLSAEVCNGFVLLHGPHGGALGFTCQDDVDDTIERIRRLAKLAPWANEAKEGKVGE